MQPTQVFVVAPMPNMMQMPTSDGSYETAAVQFPLMPWSYHGQWSYTGDFYKGEEEAPQQLPMQTEMFHEVQAAQALNVESEEVVPSQLNMGMTSVIQTLAQQQEQIGETMGSRTLRRRRHQESVDGGWWNHVEIVQDAEEACTYPGAEFEGNCTQNHCANEPIDPKEDQAQELANGLMMQLRIGGPEREAALARFESLSFRNEITSRAAQILLKEASSSDAAALATGLRGHVRSALQSKHANYVLQTLIEVMPVARASFIVDELNGFANKISRQQFGCRFVCRIIEHLPPSGDSTPQFLDEILNGDVHELCYNEFGSYVARHLLEFGLPQHKKQIVSALNSDILWYSKDKFGSHVVEAALRHCSEEDQHMLASGLLHNQDDLVAVAGSQFGRHVARALFSLPGDLRKEAVKVLLPVEGKLKALRYGRSVLQPLRAAAKS
jgi:hypothetical protein